MYFIYIIISVFCYVISKILYKEKMNPITLYLFIWVFCISVHQSKLIYFNPLKKETWLIIMIMQLIYVLGCILSAALYKYRKNKTIQNKKIDLCTSRESDKDNKQKILIKKIILVSCAIASISIIPKIVYIVKSYGINIFSEMGNIYLDSITGKMNYESALNSESIIFIALVFSGIYISRYPFKRFILIPIILLGLMQISTGSRGSLMCGMLFLCAPKIIDVLNTKKANKKDKKEKRKLYMIIISMLVVFFLITWSRGSGEFELPYASSILKSLTGNNKAIYNIVAYVSIPIAVLNEYLSNPTSSFWGAATFRAVYLVLDKLNFINYDVDFIQEYYYCAPMPSNVVTYIGELFYDFGWGALIVGFLLGLIFDRSFRVMRNKKTLTSTVIVSTCFTLVTLSFFAWYMRLAFVWYVIILGVGLGIIVDKIRCNKNKQYI